MAKGQLYVDEQRGKAERSMESVIAARDHMIESLLGGMDCTNGNVGTYKWYIPRNGKTIKLTVEVLDEQNPFNGNSNIC